MFDNVSSCYNLLEIFIQNFLTVGDYEEIVVSRNEYYRNYSLILDVVCTEKGKILWQQKAIPRVIHVQ